MQKKNYNDKQISSAKEYFASLNDDQKKKLTDTILLGLPGSLETYTLEEFKSAIEEYKNIGDEGLRNNLNAFIKEIIPTAIVCFNDLQALAVMTALKDLKIKVPEDISIIGNDDIYYAKIYPVPLTTIRAPQNEIGQKAAEILIRNIESSTLLPTERVILDTEFIIRESTKVLN